MLGRETRSEGGAVIDLIVGRGVHVAEAFEDIREEEMFAEEKACVARAVPERRREFGTVRACARRALAGLGIGPVSILPGERGAPCWPEGVVGSMTHCAGYRAAAVASSAVVWSVGVDAEPNLPLPDPALVDLVARPAEAVMIDELRRRDPGVCWDRLVFSAKESVYKTWYPLTGQWLDFAEAEIDVRAGGRFRGRLLVPGPVVDGVRLSSFEGRWLVRDGLVATAITVARVMALSTATA
jgi:4'-phosphopantetheinyl transferase EntD